MLSRGARKNFQGETGREGIFLSYGTIFVESKR